MGNNLIKFSERKRSNAIENRWEYTQRNAEHSNGVSVAGSSNENQHLCSSSIFKLNRHCLDELFDYLSLRDLHSLAQTCKSMQQMAGEFFTRNYSGAKFNCLSDGIYMMSNDPFTEFNIDKCSTMPGFIQLITWIAIENYEHGRAGATKRAIPNIRHNDLDKFKFIKLHSDEFKSVKKLSFTHVHINKQKIRYILKILPNIEVLELTHGTVDQDLYDILLKYCRNVRCIRIHWTVVNHKCKWLQKKYDKLEHLEFCVNAGDLIFPFSEYFERNPNTRSFACTALTLWSNKKALLECTAKLDTLELKCWDFHGWFDNEAILVDVLYQLHTNGFYERLNLSDLGNLYYKGNNRWRLMPFLKTLCIDSICCSSIEPFSTHLVEYVETGDFPYFWNDKMPSGKSKNETLVENLINVERLYVYRETFDILLFIKRLRNLKKLKLFKFGSAETLQLDMLNTEREKLAGAQKVTIYVPDAVYLATKWATANGNTHFSLIEMKRSKSYEWNRFHCIF